MATRRSTGAGRSSTSSSTASGGFGNGILNESIALDSNDLLAMLAGDDSDDDEEEQQDCAVLRTDLDGMFAGATDADASGRAELELKRKRGSDEQGVYVCLCACVHVAVAPTACTLNYPHATAAVEYHI